MIKKTGILVLFLIAAQIGFAYSDMPVLTHLNRGEQRDTFGFNLVDAIPQLMYSLIEQDKIKLWDSPQKGLQITFASLKSIEANSKTQFTQTNDLFMNEVWSSSRKRTRFNILGFSFINKNDKGEQVSYGFIDIEEVFSYLTDTQIPTNANGTYSITYIDALYSRNYHFNVVQFGTKTFKKDIVESLRIKEKAFNNKKKIVNQVTLPTAKKVVYEVLKSSKSENFYKAFQSFLNDNPEFFFNNGGNRLFSHLTPDIYLSISKIEVTEIWQKVNGAITYTPQSIILHFNTFALPPIAIENFDKYTIKIEFQDIKSSLRIKDFDYLLKKINTQEIPSAQSGKYIRALQNYYWTQITEYVKYD